LSSQQYQRSYSLLAASAVGFAVLLFTITLYWQGLDGPFLLDDETNIRPASIDTLSVKTLSDVVIYNTSGYFTRPVATLSFAFNILASGMDPWMFKYTNLMLHLLIGLLLLWVSLTWVDALRQTSAPHAVTTVVAVAVALWLIHPINVSTVLYPVQRMAQLSALFTVASLLIYSKARMRIINEGQGVTLLFFGTSLTCLLAILSKETGALIPLYLIALEFFIFRFSTLDTRSRRRFVAAFSLLAVLPLVFGLLYYAWNFDQFNRGYQIRDFDLAERLMTEAGILLLYLQQIVVPRLAEMGLFQDDIEVSRQFDLSVAVPAFVLLLLAATAIWLRKRLTLAGLGLALFFIGHSLESTVLPLELAFEHRNYLPGFGVILAATSLVYLVYEKLPHIRWATLIGFTAVFVLFSVLTWIRVDTWSDKRLFLQTALEFHPNSSRANTYYANLLISTGEIDRARGHLATAERLLPYSGGPTLHHLLTYCKSRGTEDIEGLKEEAIRRLEYGRLTPYTINSIQKFLSLVRDGKCTFFDQQWLLSVTRAAMNNRNLREPGSRQHLLHARALALNGLHDQAHGHFAEAATRAELWKRANILLELGSSQVEAGDYEGASETADRLEELEQGSIMQTKPVANTLRLKLAHALDEAGLLQPKEPSTPRNEDTDTAAGL
jgi:hypothetical protein